MLPNLIVIGAPKAGTTSLHHYLGAHPDVFMSRSKELGLFDRDDWRDRVEWYERQFPATARVRGESSPAYSMHPAVAGVPERMHELLPQARLIYLVRDPVERLLAHYVEWYALGLEARTLGEVIRDVEDPGNAYVAASRYAAQLDQYHRWFASSRVLVIDQHELLERRAATMARAFEFLDVNPGFSSPEFTRVLNVREGKWRLNRVGWWVVRRGAANLIRRVERLPGPLRAGGLRIVARRVEPPELDPDARAALAETLRPDAERLRRITGERFASWSV
jgi:hypothetical protein